MQEILRCGSSRDWSVFVCVTEIFCVAARSSDVLEREDLGEREAFILSETLQQPRDCGRDCDSSRGEETLVVVVCAVFFFFFSTRYQILISIRTGTVGDERNPT